MSTTGNNIDSPEFKGAWLAAYKALRRKIPFALYILPNHKRPNFICDIENHSVISDKTFSIVTWKGCYKDRIIIRDTITSSDFILENPVGNPETHTDCEPWNKTTDKFIYKGQVVSAIDLLKEIGLGKIVLSRTICKEFPKNSDSAFACIQAMQYLSGYCPEALKVLYYTTETGCWIAATPELLLNYNKSGGFSHTMALAGTRKRTDLLDAGKWDEKNLYEHNIVADVIIDTLETLCVNSIEERENIVRTGEVEHLCHDIRFKAGRVAPDKILDSLSPTPALGGFPREVALKFLDYYELHSRRCYGGYVAIEDDGNLLAYVNLRCANVGKENICFYVGGGITADSSPEKEWTETYLKSKTLSSVFSTVLDSNAKS